MAESYEFYGIRNSNLRSGELFSRDMFPRSLTIALANYMGDHGIPLNYISAGVVEDAASQRSERRRCTAAPDR